MLMTLEGRLEQMRIKADPLAVKAPKLDDGPRWLVMWQEMVRRRPPRPGRPAAR